MPPPTVWTESFPVRAYDVTPRGVASPLALCDFLQEAAGNHATRLGVSMETLLENDRAWVLAFLHLEVDRYPAWHDEVQVETWPSGLDRLYATREFLLSDRHGACGRATSAWLVIDTNRRRPLRPPAPLHEIDLPDRPPALDVERDRSAAPSSKVLHERNFRVRYHDLDLNRHVNNVRYLEWAVETLPAPWLDARELAHLTLEFRAETTADDPVRSTVHACSDASSETDSTETNSTETVRTETVRTETVRHHVQHGDTDETLALATTSWRPASRLDASTA